MLTLLRSGWFFRTAKFSFLETGPLRDGELELIPPSHPWIDSVAASVEHPSTRERGGDLARVSRRQMIDFVDACPDGHQRADSAKGIVPTYHFWMLNHDRPDLPIAGGIGLRAGTGRDVDFYYGHIGYHVYPAHRGHRFAERSVRLLMPLAGRHGINPLWITCNPDNWASRVTCDRLGATLVQTVSVPQTHPLFARGETTKCRYRLDHAPDVHR
jgi:predicted acetyltransferase